jgi:hypothetical protein
VKIVKIGRFENRRIRGRIPAKRLCASAWFQEKSGGRRYFDGSREENGYSTTNFKSANLNEIQIGADSPWPVIVGQNTTQLVGKRRAGDSLLERVTAAAEERQLSRIRLPPPVTPISDAIQEKGASTIIFWASLINLEFAAAFILSIETLDCRIHFRSVAHRNEPKAARLAGFCDQ